ncbi:MAG: hypothetical protein Q9217_004716 [Psora testacea]
MQSRPPGLALFLISDLKMMKKEAAHKLDSIMDKIMSDESPKEDTPGQVDSELPPELQPVLMDDDLPLLPDDENIFDDSNTHSDYNALDLKNTPDFDPNQDHEAGFYTDDVDVWIKADKEGSIRGARPRLYEKLNISKEKDPAVIQPQDYDTPP